MIKARVLAVFGVLGLSLLLAGCAGLLPNPAPKEAVPLAPADPTAVLSLDPRVLGEAMIELAEDYRPDRIVVGYLKNETGREALRKVLSLVGQRVVAEVELGEIVVAEIDLKDTLDVPEALGLVALLVRGALDPIPAPPETKGAPMPRVRPKQRGQPLEGLVFAEPDYIYPPPEPIPEQDSGITSLEPKVYDPNANLRPYQWALDAINAEAAWATGYTGQGITVAVIDTGVDGTHPDLVGQVVNGYAPRTATVLLAGTNSDHDNHGTHVAGIIAAKNDGKGIVGLAYNAKIMPIRIFEIYPPYTTATFIGTVPTLQGMKWAVDNGAKVLNNSWGGSAYSQAIKAGIDYALARNVVVVASAGNSRNTIWFRPASIAGVISVAAMDPHFRKADFSTMGSWLSVTAPGVRILSCVRAQTTQAGTGLPLRYDYYDGTSMSGPYVAALAAMILEKYPNATPYQVKKLIESTAKDIGAPGFDPHNGHGLIQADKALTAPLPPNDGAALRVHVVTASSIHLWNQWLPTVFMDITLRKDGRIIERGQTDYEGFVNIGFPRGDYPPYWGLGYFPVLEPGTYEVIVGGDECTPVWSNYRTANRVTAKTTVTLNPGEVKTINVQVNTTLEVTLSWTGGGADTNIDLAVYEPGVGWTFAWAPGFWGEWSADASGETGTEKYTLYPPGQGPYGGHYDDEVYPLAVRFWGGTPATVTVTVKQNTVTETYTFTLTAPGWYYAYTPGPPVSRWPGWWNNYAGPWVF
ncbi:MAG: S8 family serine peptidase [Candidatus Bipolaricaulota bacterium]|nr:S8 family serine peptidase [Candidatus Bipolaricaulota bacterium]MDW8151842.1 S8 family serine peptidase [Candidatus Bipolaricaulota bacterium]